VIDSAACDGSLPIILTEGACMNQGGINGDLYPMFPKENRHTLMSDKTGTDPNSLNHVHYVAPDSLFPSGVNHYSFRLGNGVGTDGSALALAESIKFPITVTAQNAGLTYLYAAFLREALPAVHPLNQAPRFEVRITEKKNGGDSLIKCGYYLVVAGASGDFLKGTTDFSGLWKYTNWTKVALDLTEYIGKQLTIEFRTVDCFPGIGNGTCKFRPGPHSAYAYIDLYCAPVSIISPPICVNQAIVELCAPPGYATYQWPPNQPGIIPPLDKQCVTVHHPKAGDSYQVNMTSAAGGCISSTSTTLNAIDLKITDTTVCKNSSPFQLNAMPAAPGNYTFNWRPATYLSCTDCQRPVFTPGTTMTYTVTLSEKNNPQCIFEKRITVHVEDLQVNAGINGSVCAGAPLLLKGSVGGTATSAVWSGGTGFFFPDNSTLTATYTPSAAEIKAGTVKLLLTSNTNSSCPTSFSEVIYNIYPNPVINFRVDTPQHCPPHCANFFDSSTVAGSSKIVAWKWEFGDAVNKTVNNPKVCFEKSGFYDVKLTATSDKNCSTGLLKKAMIQIFEKPVAAFTFTPQSVSIYDPTIRFIDRSSTDVISKNWDPGHYTTMLTGEKNPVHQYPVGTSGIYKVKLVVSNQYGCLDSVQHPVEVRPEFSFYIPNAFTPGRDDGKNDTFFGKGTGIRTYHLWIFDRWGNMVFYTEDIHAGWDGRVHNGENMAQQDVYVWKAHLTDVSGREHQYIGTVTLLK
jgi:gliding motility-associated-like protein